MTTTKAPSATTKTATAKTDAKTSPAKSKAVQEDNKMVQQDNEPEPASKTLFVSNISWRIKRNFLKKTAAEYGNVTDCKIINYFDKGQNRVKSKGYGFVTFENIDEATKAKEKMDGMELQTRELVVKFATSTGPRTIRKSKAENQDKENNNKKQPVEPGSYMSLFIKTFPRETKTEEITKMLTDKKFPEPAKVTTKPLRSSGLQYAIVEFKTHNDAKKVFEAVTKDGGELMNDDKKLIVEVYEDRGRKKKAKQTKKQGEKAEKGEDQVESKPKRRLYMKGMSDKTTEESLKKKCEEFGTVEKCQLKMSKKPENPTKFAYVNYETPEQAAKALEAMNEMKFEDGELLVEYAKVRRRGSRKGSKQSE